MIKKKIMTDTTVPLAFCYAPYCSRQFIIVERRLSTILPTHRPPFCQANHDKPSAASGSVAFGSVAFGSVAFGSAAFGPATFGLAAFGSMAFLVGF